MPHTIRPLTAASFVVLTGAFATACGSSTASQPAAGAAPAPVAAAGAPTAAARTGLAALPLTSGSVGDTSTFGVRVTGVAYGPDRATYNLARTSYVTIVGVTDSGIQAIMPLAEFPALLITSGSHTNSLLANDKPAAATSPSASSSAAVRQAEYDRCMARARDANRRRAQANKVVVGYDKDGKPIYGPAPERADDQYNGEGRCTAPPAVTETEGGSAQARVAGKPNPGRYLLVYASDSPVTSKDIAALSVSETDPRLIAVSIGRKLFTPRGAQWAGFFTPW